MHVDIPFARHEIEVFQKLHLFPRGHDTSFRLLEPGPPLGLLPPPVSAIVFELFGFLGSRIDVDVRHSGWALRLSIRSLSLSCAFGWLLALLILLVFAEDLLLRELTNGDALFLVLLPPLALLTGRVAERLPLSQGRQQEDQDYERDVLMHGASRSEDCSSVTAGESDFQTKKHNQTHSRRFVEPRRAQGPRSLHSAFTRTPRPE